MTDGRRSRRPAPARRGSGAIVVAWGAGALFLTLLALLAARVADGQDPALRARAAAHVPPRRVLLRKVYERRVIVHLPASAPPQPAHASQQVSAGGAFAGAAVVTRAS